MPTWQARTKRRVRRRVTDKRVWLLVALGLAILLSYQVYVQRLVHKNAATRAQVRVIKPKVATLTKVQCANTKLFYDIFNALVQDTSPDFGSPPDGPPVPGARDHLINRLYSTERLSAKALRKQGCKITVPRTP